MALPTISSHDFEDMVRAMYREPWRWYTTGDLCQAQLRKLVHESEFDSVYRSARHAGGDQLLCLPVALKCLTTPLLKKCEHYITCRQVAFLFFRR